MPLAKDPQRPSREEEERKHRKQRLVRTPSFYFSGAQCPGCGQVTPVVSPAQTAVPCAGCSTALHQPLEEKPGSFRRKQHSKPPESTCVGN